MPSESHSLGFPSGCGPAGWQLAQTDRNAAISSFLAARSHFREAWRRSRRRVAMLQVAFARNTLVAPERILVAPTDLRPVDPYVAEEMIEGRFPLAGRLLVTGGESPFQLELPSVSFAARLHSFSWLRHFRALRDGNGPKRARDIAEEWLAVHGRLLKGVAWEPAVATERLQSWLSHSPILLQGADANFYQKFIRALAVHIIFLKRLASTLPPDETRLKMRIALASASLAVPQGGRTIRKAARNLDAELERQILPDGGHVSRNPRVLLELLLDLLPLRQTYINLGYDLPARLIQTIDKLYPALRFFRHADGDLALFNGATATLVTELSAVLRYDESAGEPFRSLPHTGFQRLSSADTVVIADTGHPASADQSQRAHAGCLSFELSSGRHRFIVNAGSPRYGARSARQMARATAAHSTVTLNETSSARISPSPFLGSLLVKGPHHVIAKRREDDEGFDRLRASHDGYLAEFGFLHEREIALSADGSKLFGADRFMRSDRSVPPADCSYEAVARFHIHPAIDLTQAGPDAVLLRAPDGESWLFTAPGMSVRIEEDIFFADISGPRAGDQIAIAYLIGETPELRWQLNRRK